MLISMNREITYNDVIFRVIESFDVMGQNMLMVVKKKDWESKSFPIQTFIIPSED